MKFKKWGDLTDAQIMQASIESGVPFEEAKAMCLANALEEMGVIEWRNAVTNQHAKADITFVEINP